MDNVHSGLVCDSVDDRLAVKRAGVEVVGTLDGEALSTVPGDVPLVRAPTLEVELWKKEREERHQTVCGPKTGIS